MVPDDTKQTEVKHLSIKSEPENPLQQFDNDIPLDKCLCVEILSNWLNFSDENDHLNLLGKIKAYESKLSAELIIKYENELRSINVSSDIKGIQSQTENKSQHEGFDRPPPGLPDALSQLMHQLEGLKIVLDIDKKVDEILKKNG